MRKFLGLSVVFLIIALRHAQGAPEKDDIITQGKAVRESARQKDLAGFEQLVSPHVKGVFADGTMAMADYFKALPSRTMTSIELRDFDVIFPDPETAAVT